MEIGRKRMAKKKHQGHYCWVCGEYKSNESFSGRGHARHICRACSRLSTEERQKMKRERDFELPAIEDLESPFADDNNIVYDEVDRLPQPIYEEKRYPKLKSTEKESFREFIRHFIIEYWEYKRLIPDGAETNQIIRKAIAYFEEDWQFSIKQDRDLRIIVHNMVISTINKLLKAENQKKQEG